MKVTVTFSLVFILLSISSTLSIAQETLEYQLAIIDAGKFLPKNHFTVTLFRSLLEDLSYTYVEDGQQIADMTVKSRQVLKEKGIYESLLKMMEGMNALFSKKIENQQYAEYIAAYMTLRMDGHSHTDAVLGLDAILEEFGVY